MYTASYRLSHQERVLFEDTFNKLDCVLFAYMSVREGEACSEKPYIVTLLPTHENNQLLLKQWVEEKLLALWWGYARVKDVAW